MSIQCIDTVVIMLYVPASLLNTNREELGSATAHIRINTSMNINCSFARSNLIYWLSHFEVDSMGTLHYQRYATRADKVTGVCTSKNAGGFVNGNTFLMSESNF